MTRDLRPPYPPDPRDDATNDAAKSEAANGFNGITGNGALNSSAGDGPSSSPSESQTDGPSRQLENNLSYRGAPYPERRDLEMSEAILRQRAETAEADIAQPPAERVYRGVRYLDGERYAPERIQVTQGKGSGPLQWFYDRRVENKQLTGLLASKVLSVVGLVFLSWILLARSSQRQLTNQVVSELSAIAKELGDQAIATAPADGVLLEAATEYAAFESLPDDLKASTRASLQTRLELNQLEYVAIVSPELRVVASSSNDRSGELFNPNNLVSSAVRQRESKSAISRQTVTDLQQLGIPVSDVDEAALVQYSVAPIFEGGTPTNRAGVGNSVIGVLVSGDVLGEDSATVQDALTNFSEGYSEIYLEEPNGSYDLVALAQSGELVPRQNAQGVDFSFLERALEAASVGLEPGIVSNQFRLTNGEPYTVAATAIVDGSGKAVGVLQHGLPEQVVRSQVDNARWWLLGAVPLVLLIDFIIARLLGRSVARPLRNLQAATESFASGNRSARADVFARDEVGQVASAFNELAAAVASSESSLRFQSETQGESARRARTLSELTSDIRSTLEAEAIFSTSVDRAREVLGVDRVLVYRFNPNYTGGVATAESVGEGWPRAKGQVLEDPMLPDSVERFMAGQVSTVENIETENLTECHCRLLRELEVKANMVAPIVVGDQLVGLLCAHQCSSPRQWQPEEINMIQQIATQVGYALSQAKLLANQQQVIQREQALSNLVATIRDTTEREKIFRTVTRQVKLTIDTSRVIIYLFDESWKGTVAAEAVGSQWTSALGAEIADPCFAKKYVEQYRTGRIKATTDIYEAGLTDCHIGQLEPYEVRANLVAPIVVEGRLLGLLIAHECRGPRQWSDVNVNFIQRAATQLGFALEQAEVTAQKEAAVKEMSTLAEELMHRQETLQTQLIALLGDVESAADGDLTVRADVSAGEIGTVADFFNSIVESLRELVTQVKTSAAEVNESLGQNESAIKQLAEEAQQQAQQTNLTLESMGNMTASIQQVAHQAEEAAAVAKVASEQATRGGEAMDLTVSNIMNLRQTVGQTAKKVKRLGESSQQINKAVSLINQISQQTNLLAINAGIEAARAGEDGQGFAAVAEEVSELASRSASAAEEIERIVDAIQRETGDVVEAIEQSTAEVVEGTRRVEDAKASLTQILDGSQKMDALAHQISEATSSQVATSASVSTLMAQIAQLAQRTSESSQQVSEALDRTLGVSKNLQSQVSTFVVEREEGEGDANGGLNGGAEVGENAHGR
ncbi:MAG: GAF domain-containing protein [Cyanobacteria bacterium J06560_6]